MQNKNKNTILKISEFLQKDIDLDMLDSRGAYFSFSVVKGTPNTDCSGLVLYNCINKKDTELQGSISLRNSSYLDPNFYLKAMSKYSGLYIILYDGIQLENCTLSNIKISGTIPNSTLENMTFENVEFYGCHLDGSIFKNCRFMGTKFTEYYAGREGSYRNLRFENCTFEALLLGEPQWGDDTEDNIQRTVFRGDFENTFFDKDCELSTDDRYIEGVEYGIRNDDSIVFESDDIEGIWDFSPDHLD